MPQHELDAFFYPKSVAIVGASENLTSFGRYYMDHILSYGYKGKIYPVNPKAPQILGVKAYPDLEQIPDTIDFVISLIALGNAPDLLTKCSKKGVKAVHVMAGRGSETGRPEAKKIEDDILKMAKEYGIRVLGPNCLGVFCPKTGLSFGYDFPKEPGTVGAMIQSGGNSTDLIRFSALRGIKFSKIISYGNALDINQNDALEYLAQDQDTKIILCYIEGLKGSPKKFYDLLKNTTKSKPVAICKAGRTEAGVRQALSHTASLAGSGKIWEIAIRQAGAVPVRDLDELVNQGVAFYYLPAIKGKRVGLGGGGGGRSVLSADVWEENGFVVSPLPQEIREDWKRKGSPLWDWISNPADKSIFTQGEQFNLSEALIDMSKHPNFDFIVGTVTEDVPFIKEQVINEITDDVEGFIKTKKGSDKPFLVIYTDRPLGIKQIDDWRWRLFAETRTRLMDEQVAIFTNIDQAAKAVRELIFYYQKREQKTK